MFLPIRKSHFHTCIHTPTQSYEFLPIKEPYIYKILYTCSASPFRVMSSACVCTIPFASNQTRRQPSWEPDAWKIKYMSYLSVHGLFVHMFIAWYMKISKWKLDFYKCWKDERHQVGARKADLDRSCSDKRKNLSEQEITRTSSLQQDRKLSRSAMLCFNVNFGYFPCLLSTREIVETIRADSREPAISWNLI